jgi:hypothetical protein
MLAFLLSLLIRSGVDQFLVEIPGKPICHKNLNVAVDNWLHAHGNQDGGLPNVNGLSSESLLSLQPHINDSDLADSYMYVPGLRRDDPGDLVLFYMKTPTKWRWHGERPALTDSPMWMVVPVDFVFFGSRRITNKGEFSESLTDKEFEERLGKTLKYLQAESRPFADAVVKEHSSTLEKLKMSGPQVQHNGQGQSD